MKRVVPNGFAQGLDLVEMKLELLTQVVRISCPELALNTVEPINAGQNSYILLINSEWAFRFPKYEAGVRQLSREDAILDLIADRVPLEVPRPVYRNADASTAARPFIGYKKIAGEPLEAGVLQQIGDEVIARRLAGQLACFLRELHRVSADELLFEKRQNYNAYAEWEELYARVQTKLYPHLKPEARQFLIDEDPQLSALMDRVLFYQGTFALQEALFGLENEDTEAFRAGIDAANARV